MGVLLCAATEAANKRCTGNAGALVAQFATSAPVNDLVTGKPPTSAADATCTFPFNDNASDSDSAGVVDWIVKTIDSARRISNKALPVPEPSAIDAPNGKLTDRPIVDAADAGADVACNGRSTAIKGAEPVEVGCMNAEKTKLSNMPNSPELTVLAPIAPATKAIRRVSAAEPVALDDAGAALREIITDRLAVPDVVGAIPAAASGRDTDKLTSALTLCA